MKKLILTAFTLVAAAILAHAQGTISLQTGKGTVITNGADVGLGTGNAYSGAGSYYYELLDMTASQWGGLSTAQQEEASDPFYSQGLSLWTDSGISGVNAGALSPGGITGEGGVTGTTAANWAAPTSNSGYTTATNFDYYMVVGWSANLGTSWGAFSNNIANFFSGVDLTSPAFFGDTSVAYNYAGGGPSGLPAPDAFSPSGFTGLAGSGLPSNSDALVLYAIIPEPTTLALAGLGGLSMLLLRRRKT